MVMPLLSLLRPSGQLFGGLRPSDAKRIYAEAMRAPKARKNLFLVRCQSWAGGDISQIINLYATDVEHGLGEVSGTKARVGAAAVDVLGQLESGTMRITTLDDQFGTLKGWFEAHISAIARKNGTFGVPAGYAISIQVQHAFATPSAFGYVKRGLYRAQSCETGLSRREGALAELSMTFTQLDHFM
jgi:hypothetical protein